jgi:putative ABC transport system ATP-binding protein
MIELKSAGLTYPGPPAVPALRPFDLIVAAGEHLSIVGPSGSGKSTLLNVLGLLDRPTCGTYRLDGIDTATLADGQRASLRARRIGFVFQSFHLLMHRTAEENVALGLLYTGEPTRKRHRRAAAALDRVGLGHLREALPSRLSGGERQRTAIARALVGRPAILLCDEPTGNLDSAAAASVLDLIAGLWDDGMTVLVITHDREVAARGRRTVSIHDGVVREEPS